MSCCCPPAISAIFCLWAKSGFSKSSVAGALTFFPPDPPLYTFSRSLNGEILPNTDNERNDNDDNENNDDTKKLNRVREREDQCDIHPAEALAQRAMQLRVQAKKRNKRDALDAQLGVSYTFITDPRLSSPPGYSGSIEAVKIPYKTKSKNKTAPRPHVACVIYRIKDERVNDQTKTIIYSHGNATDIGAMHFMQVIIAKGIKCNVVMYDYSGYGESGGVPLEGNTYTDIETVYDYTVKHVVRNNIEGNVILYGQSVGGGPSCYLASKKIHVGGLILHSAFMSGMRVLTPSRALACLDIFPNITRIKKVNCPVMVIHGVMDEEVTFEHGKALHEAVPEDCKRPPWWVKDRGHNDITDGRQKILEYIQKLKLFVESLDD